ncbi:MAG: DUF3298 and DUF4163 domain-containing protein [Sporomusaceae bacterium]|nr:DUF3298 and DUF4163 domain-containing protein [Sporomusaceae bacterium]
MKLARTILACALLLLAMPAAGAETHPQSVSVVTQSLHQGVLDFQYPRVIGMPDAKAQDIINAAIARRVEGFRAGVAAGPSGPFTETAMARYAVRHNGDGKLSLTLTFYVYQGGAHGMTYMRGLTFDLATGREYRLPDLVPYDGGGREKIDAAIAAQLKDRNLPLIAPFKGVADNPDFYLAADGRPVVFFQLYELAPYVYGFLEFPLSIGAR